ncbi:TPA: recombinase family protein [Streptococcus suis]|uniref:Resolvase/integrase n=1 Tax=Streptococcus suis TaxID=1307 RepID=A0A0Z8J479_STRSU
MRYGYIRVSTREQNIDRQLTAILKEEIDKNHIFIDKASGKDFERTNYKRLICKALCQVKTIELIKK